MYCNKRLKLCLCLALVMPLTLTGFTNTKVETKKEIIETVVNYREFNIPQYRFTDDVIKDAYVIQYDTFKITQPYKKSNKQVLTYKQVAEEFQKLPKILTKNVNEIQLLDYNNIEDAYWADILNMKDFKSYAVGGYKQICFYANSQLSVEQNNGLVVSTLLHESAHNFDEAMSSIDDRYSSSTEWILIMDEDLNIKDSGYGLFCSKYAKDSSSSIEDFAEAVMQYVMDNEKFTEDYPNRSKKLNELLN